MYGATLPLDMDVFPGVWFGVGICCWNQKAERLRKTPRSWRYSMDNKPKRSCTLTRKRKRDQETCILEASSSIHIARCRQWILQVNGRMRSDSNTGFSDNTKFNNMLLEKKTAWFNFFVTRLRLTCALVELGFTKYVLMLLSLRYAFLSIPSPASNSKSSPRHLTTSSVMCTLLRIKGREV